MESDLHLLYFTKLWRKSQDFYFLVGIHLNETWLCLFYDFRFVWSSPVSNILFEVRSLTPYCTSWTIFIFSIKAWMFVSFSTVFMWEVKLLYWCRIVVIWIRQNPKYWKLFERATITWNNIDLSSLMSSDIHMKAVLQKLPQPLITRINVKITFFNISFISLRGQWSS